MGNIESIPETRVEDINVTQFKIIKTIGKGSFGKVYKVEHKERKELYALKIISKEKCIKMDAVNNIIRERKILECLDHPLICNMRFAFQDNQFMFMAMDLMLGGDLRSHITNKDHNENVVKFWIAELICAIKYLHSQGIVHRDIKPDNILLDHEGHVHLSDFNIACQIPKNNERQLSSLSGTAVYFAPELFKGNGYSKDVDWWSLGITFYECIYGIRPWLHCNTIEDLSKQVLYKPIDYPYKENLSIHCISAIKCFLEKDDKKRFGFDILNGWKKIISHPFFKSIDWNKIDNKQYEPLYVPTLFEDILIEKNEANLSIEKVGGLIGWFYRNKKRNNQLQSNRFNQDLKLLQDKYKPFDYTIFDRYEGFLDKRLRTVGPPPHWVKPAFPGADHGSTLPVCKIHLDNTTNYHFFDMHLNLPHHFNLQDSIHIKNSNFNSTLYTM